MGYFFVLAIGFAAGVFLANPTKQFLAGLTKKAGK